MSLSAKSGRITLWLSFPIITLLIWQQQALRGFNPTDDGFILAQSWRILQGERPIVDFTSPRPLGSAFLHTLDFALPPSLFAASRLITVAELVGIAFLTTALISRRIVKLNPIGFVALAVVALVVDLGTWPVMAWHTIDGLFFALVALSLLERSENKNWLTAFAWLSAGISLSCKQGFALVAIALLLMTSRKDLRRQIKFLPLMALPVLLIFAYSGFAYNDVRNQIYGGTLAQLLHPVVLFLKTLATPFGLLAAALAIAVALLPLPNILSVFALAAPTLWLAANQHFSLNGTWALLPLLTLIALSVIKRANFKTAGAIALLNWAVALSWGVDTPSLAAGLTLIIALALGIKTSNLVIELGLVAVAAIALASVVTARANHIYREPIAAKVIATSNQPALAQIKMSPQSAAYLNSISRCLAKYPARDVAILPDGPAIYPIFKLHNPFELDWWESLELPKDHQARIAASAARLNQRGGWLILSQSYPLAHLSGEADPSKPGKSTFPAVAQLMSKVRGQSVKCDSFTGIYRP